ncbi:MAG: hypothetical protein OXI45_04960 [Acidobacteriota bacterium]|nr:hypothetical protein [Acidobacteriota bacterium]
MRGILVSGCAVLLLLAACGPDRPEQGTLPPLHYLATADQAGPVAYRDPVGAISPDGNWLATLERGQVRIAPAAGGAAQRVGAGTASIRYLAWLPDSRRVLVHENVFDRSRQEWWIYDRADGSRRPLWPDRPADASPSTGSLAQLSWSADGSAVAGVTREDGGSTVWVLDADGRSAQARATAERLSFPAWSPDGRIACLVRADDHQQLHLPCSAPEPLFDDQEAYGRIAFSPDGEWVIYGVPGEGGFLDLWMRRVSGGRRTRLTRFARDAYSPSVGAGGELVFKSQDYRVFLATVPADGGRPEPLTAFQSETPTWSPDGSEIAFTFGSWRHVTDDIHYPDIAQHLGTVTASVETPHREPQRVVRQSYSEDQGMQWSPNGRWIVFHTHEESDDIWLMAADGTGAHQISEDGHETGWARWSPDSRFVVFTSYRRDEAGARHGGLYVIGVDQETGEIAEPQQQVPLEGFSEDVIQAEWADAGETLLFESAAAVGQKSLWTVPRTGGAPTRFHEFGSDQIHSGIGVSPDGAWAAYIDRADDNFFQVFRVPVGGGEAEQVTADPTHKTQPAWSPLGDRIAFTVFSYRAHFWRIHPFSLAR